MPSSGSTFGPGIGSAIWFIGRMVAPAMNLLRNSTDHLFPRSGILPYRGVVPARWATGLRRLSEVHCRLLTPVVR